MVTDFATFGIGVSVPLGKMFTKLLKALLCKYFRRDWTFFFAFRIAGETIRLPQRFADRAVDLPSALDERRDRGDLPKRSSLRPPFFIGYTSSGGY